MARIGIPLEKREDSAPKKIGVRKMKDMNQDPTPSGEAIEQNKSTQRGWEDNTDQTTGGSKYKPSGYACGMT
jgi:hypothetical protein